MAQEFYKSAQSLYQEFQKRELHYLNAERNWNNKISKRDLNVPLQEYLQEIDKKEKEAEMTYRNIMRQMESLDNRTTLMSVKLEKLRMIFSKSIRTDEIPNWSSGDTSSNFPAYNAASNYGDDNLVGQRQILHSVSTQTENRIYCGRCKSDLLTIDQQSHFPDIGNYYNIPQTDNQFEINENYQPMQLVTSPFSNEHNGFKSTSHPRSQADYRPIQLVTSPFGNGHNGVKSTSHSLFSTANFHPEIVSNQQTVNLSNLPLVSTPFSNGQNILESAQSTSNSHPTPPNFQAGISVNNPTAGLSKCPSTPFISEQNILESVKSTNEGRLSRISSNIMKSSQLQPSISELGEPTLIVPRKISLSGDKLMPTETLEIEDSDISKDTDVDITGLSTKSISVLNTEVEMKRSDIEENVELSKSDEGSMNHEFDFLESETLNVSKDIKSQVAKDITTSTSLSKTSILIKGNKSLSAELNIKDQVATASKNSSLVATVDKSETSGSVSGPPSIPSENVSVASDSDSLPEKGTPLKTSAAYQALLGNTAIPPINKKKLSDSDSEDEVEKALANAVRKGSQALPISSVQSKDAEKSAPTTIETKPPVRTSKPSLGSKPQSKLSKNTRKVLGLDTSSGSEVEVSVKPPEKKTDEDSDEFDFFD